MNGKHFLSKSLALTAALLSVLLASCNFWSKSDDLEPATSGMAEPQYCTITGSVSQTGAYPSSLASSGSRTALPSFTTGIEYSVSATDSTQKISSNVHLDTHSFEVRIPVTAENVNWTITLTGSAGIGENSVAIFSGSKEIDVSRDTIGTINSIRIVASLQKNDVGTGSVNLAFNIEENSEITYVEAVSSQENWVPLYGEFFDGQTNITLSASDIDTGAYMVTFNFYDNSGENKQLLYSCSEAINVFANLTTNVWSSTAPYFTPDGNGGTIFKITNTLVNSFKQTTLYVFPDNSDSADANSGSYFAPLKTVAAAAAKCTDTTQSYTILVDGTTEETLPIEIQPSTTVNIRKRGTDADSKAEITRSTNPVDGISNVSMITVASGATLTMNGITLDGNERLVTNKGGCITMSGTSCTLIDCNIRNGFVSDAGGGLFAEYGTTKLIHTQIQQCRANTKGGAIFCTGDNSAFLFIDKDSIIGQEKTESESDITTPADAANYSNYAGEGGGIYSDYGVDGHYATVTMNGKIMYNYSANSRGGGGYLAGGHVTIGGTAEIAYNGSATNGGGITACNVFTIESDAQIYSNKCVSKGGGLYISTSADVEGVIFRGNSVESANNVYGGGIYIEKTESDIEGASDEIVIKNCIIENNLASSSNNDAFGGGVYILAGAVTMDGGNISGNTATIGKGVCVTSTTFNMSGSPYVAPDDDVYLDISSPIIPITITGALSLQPAQTTVATITLADYTSGSTVLQGGGSPSHTLTADDCGKFAVTANEGNEYGVTLSDTVGVLIQKITAANAAAAIVNLATGNHTVVLTGALNDVNITSIKTALQSISGVSINLDMSDCTGLTELPINAFYGCTNLVSVTLPESLTAIENYAFYGCTNLVSVTLPESLTVIRGFAFTDCSSLTSIHLPANVSSIPSDLPFQNCTNLTTITVDEDNRHFVSVDNVLFSADMTKLLCYPAGKTDDSYTVPSGVTTINNRAFWACRIVNLIISEGVKLIDIGAFNNSDLLETVSLPQSIEKIVWRVFSDCSSLVSLPFADGAQNNWKHTNNYSYTEANLVAYDGNFSDPAANAVNFTDTSHICNTDIWVRTP